MFLMQDYRADGSFGPCLAIEGPKPVFRDDDFAPIAKMFFWRDHERIKCEGGVEIIRRKPAYTGRKRKT